MKLKFSRTAEHDLEDIGLYIARDNARRAKSFVHDIKRQCHRISEQPTLYPIRHALGERLRSCSFGRYVIFFSTNESSSELLIHRILHSAMDIGKHLPAGSTPNMLSQNIASYL